jgi:hypothetical protein
MHRRRRLTTTTTQTDDHHELLRQLTRLPGIDHAKKVTLANAQGLVTARIGGVRGRLFAFATSSWIPDRLSHVLLLYCCVFVAVCCCCRAYLASLKYDEHNNFQKERVDNFNYNTGVDWVARMQEKQLNLSAAQQSKFNEKKALLSQQFPKSILYQSVLDQFAANVLNDDFAYL